MKRPSLLLIILIFSCKLFAQYENMKEEGQEEEKTACITIGVLQGGGSLVGADFERLLSKRVGLQVGLGYIGYGAGLNFHLQPTIRSSFLSVQYWNQGVGSSFTQNVIGGTYVFRGKKWFTCQIGLGFPLSKGPAFPDSYEQSPAMFLYSIGAYIPL